MTIGEGFVLLPVARAKELAEDQFPEEFDRDELVVKFRGCVIPWDALTFELRDEKCVESSPRSSPGSGQD